MSCGPGIYTRLPMTSPPGGNWTYIGYNATSDTGPWTGTPVVPLVNVVANTSLASWGYDFTLATDGKTPGYYKFQYDYVGGSNDVIIYIQSDTVCAGQNYGITIEEGQAFSFNLFSLLASPSCPSPQTGGAWVNEDSAPGFNPTTSVLDTTSILEGQYVFEYIIAEPGDLDCSDCSTSARVTLTVASPAALDATVAQSNVSCTYALTVHNSVTDVVNNMYLSVPTEAYGPTVMYRAKVTNCDAEVIYDNVVTVPNAVRIYTGITTVEAMQTGGYLSIMKLRVNTGVTIIVPLEPGTAIYSGLGGTTNATELTYNIASPGIFLAAIRKATINYLGTLGFIQGVDFDMQMPVFSSSNVVIRFACKHNPSGRWLGWSRTFGEIRYYPQPFALRNVLFGGYFGADIALTESFSSLPCFAGSNALVRQISVPGLSFLYDSDYNFISVLTSDVAATVTGTNSRTCTDKALTANATGCAGAVSYLWGIGQTTQTIKVPYIAGTTHTVQVSCTSPSSSVTKSTVL